MGNQKFRQQFQQILMDIETPSGMPKEELQEALKTLVEFVNVHIPQKLFRYRSCNESNIDAFDTDKFYAVTPDKFNDPYDALLQYDKDFLMQMVELGARSEAVKWLIQNIKETNSVPLIIEQMFGKENVELMLSGLSQISEMEFERLYGTFISQKTSFFKDIESVLKASSLSMKRQAAVACFSENIHSVLMWSHYADYHKGFALEYNMQHFEMKCGGCDKRESCKDMVLGNIYPVIYSNKRYNATKYAEYYLGQFIATRNNSSLQNPDTTAFLKAFLHKSSQWNYEKEWRVILNRADCNYSAPVGIEMKPVAIYYGQAISNIYKMFLHHIAISKGIAEYQMYIEDASNQYTMKYKKI